MATEAALRSSTGLASGLDTAGIIDAMTSTLAEPRKELSPHAPQIESISIPQDKIGELIGPGGKNIRRITELSGAQLDIEEDGTVNIFAINGEAMAIAKREVEMITAEVEEGKIYDGKVSGVKEFGAFVEVLPGKDGLVHISELSNERVNKVEDIVKEGQEVVVKVIEVQDSGKIGLRLIKVNK